MSFTLTPNFITYSDSYMPIIPSSISLFRPVGATVVIPGPFPLPSYLDLNQDERVHRQVTRYFRFKTLDKWLYEDMNDLLAHLRVDGGNVQPVAEATTAKDSAEATEAKINFIERNLLTEDTMHGILKKLVRGAGLNWYDLHKNEFFVKEAIKNHLRKMLKERAGVKA